MERITKQEANKIVDNFFNIDAVIEHVNERVKNICGKTYKIRKFTIGENRHNRWEIIAHTYGCKIHIAIEDLSKIKEQYEN